MFSCLFFPVEEGWNTSQENEESHPRFKRLGPNRVDKYGQVDKHKQKGKNRVSPCFVRPIYIRSFPPKDQDC
jgi:hypothetical protein